VKIAQFETFLVNSGLRNYLFIRLTSDDGLTGIGEASLEWQEKTVETLLHEWVKDRILGEDAFDIERIIDHLVRDQYQNGSTIMTAISGVEIGLWDLVGKACLSTSFWGVARKTGSPPMPMAGMAAAALHSNMPMRQPGS